MRTVHRLATTQEKETWPEAHTYNRATGKLHTRGGFAIPGSAAIAPKRRRRKELPQE